ncbi:hypothetical protein B296_00027470, partial [Ensete ventricosum]
MSATLLAAISGSRSKGQGKGLKHLPPLPLIPTAPSCSKGRHHCSKGRIEADTIVLNQRTALSAIPAAATLSQPIDHSLIDPNRRHSSALPSATALDRLFPSSRTIVPIPAPLSFSCSNTDHLCLTTIATPPSPTSASLLPSRVGGSPHQRSTMPLEPSPAAHNNVNAPPLSSPPPLLLLPQPPYCHHRTSMFPLPLPDANISVITATAPTHPTHTAAPAHLP